VQLNENVKIKTQSNSQGTSPVD